jgi:hypothetical protein
MPATMPASFSVLPRSKDEHEHQDRERRDVLVLDREIGRPERLDQADEQAAEHCSRHRADAAEHRRGERLHAGEEADVEVDHPVVQQEHQARNRREARPHHEGQRNGAVDIDPDQRRHAEVLLAGALGAAERSAVDQQREADHQADGDQDDQHLQIAQRDGELAALEEAHAAGDHRLQGLVARALEELNVVLQEDRHADRGDQGGEARRVAQRPIGDALEGPSVHRGQQHRRDEHDQQGERHPADADQAEHEEGDDRDERADHENFAVREIDHADDAVHHRVADRDQPVDHAERQPVDQLLEEIAHRGRKVRRDFAVRATRPRASTGQAPAPRAARR